MSDIPFVNTTGTTAGKITTFKTGAIRDSQDNKPDFVETSSPIADWRYAIYMTGKKKKYGQGNFKKGITKESYLASMLRHMVKLRALEDCKTFNLPIEEWMEPQEDHVAAIRFNVDGFMHEEEVEKGRNREDIQIDRGLGYKVNIDVSNEKKCVNLTHNGPKWQDPSCDEEA